MSDKPNTAKLLLMLKGVAGREPECPEPGFYPTRWWAKEWVIDISKAREYLARGIEAGVVERKTFLVGCLGSRRRVPHYKVNQPLK